jgi:hypothetical protein
LLSKLNSSYNGNYGSGYNLRGRWKLFLRKNIGANSIFNALLKFLGVEFDFIIFLTKLQAMLRKIKYLDIP